MFTKKEVKNALTWIFCQYDIDDLDIFGLDESNVSAVVELLAPDVLARKYKKEAHKVNTYFVSTGPEDEGTFHGYELFPSKAVCLCAVDCQVLQTERLRIESESELWLLSNLKFAHVHCARVLTLDGENVTSVTECRNFVKIIKGKDDLFVDAQTLFDELDDAVAFTEALAAMKASDNQ